MPLVLALLLSGCANRGEPRLGPDTNGPESGSSSSPAATSPVVSIPPLPTSSALGYGMARPTTSAPSQGGVAHAACLRSPARDEGGQPREAVSPDGHVRVFVVVDPSRKLDTALGAVDHEDLCASVDGASARLLLAGRSAGSTGTQDGSDTLAGFDGFVFSRDGRSLYFTSIGWVTSGAAHVVELASGRERFLVDGSIRREIAAGPYAGALLAAHWRLDDLHPVDSPDFEGRIEMLTIVSRDGKLVRRLPSDAKEAERVIRER